MSGIVIRTLMLFVVLAALARAQNPRDVVVARLEIRPAHSLEPPFDVRRPGGRS
jgi:hypothetical protein